MRGNCLNSCYQEFRYELQGRIALPRTEDFSANSTVMTKYEGWKKFRDAAEAVLSFFIGNPELSSQEDIIRIECLSHISRGINSI